MKMLELLEHDKDKLLAQLEEAKTPEKANTVIAEEMDSLLLRYNKHCTNAVARDAAAYMLQTAKLSAPLVNSIGDVQVWEKQNLSDSFDSGKSAPKMPLRSLLLLAGSAVCMFTALFITVLANPSEYRWTDLLLALILGAAAPVLACFSGREQGRLNPSVSRGKKFRSNTGRNASANLLSMTYESRCTVDSGKIYVSLHNIAFAIDQNLQDLENFSPVPSGTGDRFESLSASLTSAAGSGTFSEGQSGYTAISSSFSEKELDLFASLLEAGCSGDGSYALDQISDVRYFLHQNGVEAVDYNGSNRDMFDVMPSPRIQTIRPALVKNNILLKKGIAAGEY